MAWAPIRVVASELLAGWEDHPLLWKTGQGWSQTPFKDIMSRFRANTAWHSPQAQIECLQVGLEDLIENQPLFLADVYPQLSFLVRFSFFLLLWAPRSQIHAFASAPETYGIVWGHFTPLFFLQIPLSLLSQPLDLSEGKRLKHETVEKRQKFH